MPNKVSHILNYQMEIIKGLLDLTVYRKKLHNVFHNGRNRIVFAKTCIT